ncbi:GTP pyrophosphokinase [Shimazuella kribbensis]|uniref:GTP pyrophosphokinase n=1 Tax=Shimazuella kribbensis TaxID=139808 RepID=UPI000424C346|nr:GTP pyrophosphokinase family protein [Shimazuella kribbensis]
MKNKNITELKTLRTEITRFLLSYKFALQEMETKVNILKEEFQVMNEYNPIEHITTRLKTPESILKKIVKKGVDPSFHAIQKSIRDIAGIRITCSFVDDIYKVSDMIQHQQDISVVEIKDYIQNPKPNGYQSLHLIIQIPIFMSDRTEHMYVEIQIRTIAMDFWASLEHKIYYKYDRDIPQHIQDGLKEAASQAAMLDRKMQQLNREINILKQQNPEEDDVYLSNKHLQQLQEKLFFH